MRETVNLQVQMRDAIEQELSQRTGHHQQAVRKLQTAASAVQPGSSGSTRKPLVMLAHGDSWFDYPLSGNNVSLDGSTDIIAHLSAMGDVKPIILNVSHFCEATSEELSLPKQQRMIDALQDPRNWLKSGKPDAILFSGGGDDIAGNQFCIFLDYSSPSAAGLNMTRFRDALAGAEASYLDLFAFRDHYAHGVPIFGHCYDFPIPNGTHPHCAGPWLAPSLQFCGWSAAEGRSIVQQALLEFKAMLARLAADTANNFILVNTQGLLGPGDWANELHPFPNGFKMLADKFLSALRPKFPGRI